MKWSVITRLTIIATGAAIVCGLGLAGIATGKVNHHPGHRSPFNGSGHSRYESTGQACFRAAWEGSGTWNTNYMESAPEVDGSGNDTTTDKDSSSYSWHLGEVESGADCALELLRFPGAKPSGGAVWNLGFTRITANGQDEYTAPNQAPVSTNCSQTETDHARAAAVTGNMSIKRKGSAIVFVMSTDLPTDNCGAYSAPRAVAGGKLGPFLLSDSVAVPRKVFEKDGEVKIKISSDPKHGPQGNCGLQPAEPPPTVTCSQAGSWQGTLTLRQG